VSRRALAYIAHDPDPTRTVNRTTATKLIRVPATPPPTPPTRPVPRAGVGARRRVEALVAQGWPVHLIARAAQLSPSTLMPTHLSTSCSMATFTAVGVVFDQWRYQLGPSPRTARHAARRGYLPWQAWDGRIDDPAATPDLSGLPAPLVAAWLARHRATAGVAAA